MIISKKCILNGEVEVSSSKNAILPVLAASLLTEGKVVINNAPNIRDVKIITELIKQLGIIVDSKQKSLIFNGDINDNNPPYELVSQIRASFLVMGPLLARRGQVKVALPGGCAIGTRPIDLHLKGFEALGARITLSCGDVIAQARKLRGNHIYLDYPSVGATENIIMAATMAEGTSYIENAALEPEIVDLANFINSMGGKISGAGSNIIKITGVKNLQATDYTPIPDRIEAGTFMVATAATGGQVKINNVIPEHLKAITAKLIETGAEIEEGENYIQITRKGNIKPVYIKTLPYPGFPTDMQAQFMAYLCCTDGSSIITESVFENRFMHVQELLRMGAKIKTEGRTAIIKGTDELTGAAVKATDLRAGAALLIAGLTARGPTMITESCHIDRGYEDIVNKLNKLGANISRN
ncbi:MAG: UDP-N-acetylglucosamine 1-carboxyvinyltransferase [Syntrophomonadaceae bacterium]|nr:UDP-N-acetylglucosamine 1-carboxyvinyltransferase [Syntrophomonadaceae bacterium]MDD4549129.1 UDP-N-acetylglucosamine 1-carboxyvinyltransferase [Syntrophomonadaceae bacterium]